MPKSKLLVHSILRWFSTTPIMTDHQPKFMSSYPYKWSRFTRWIISFIVLSYGTEYFIVYLVCIVSVRYNTDPGQSRRFICFSMKFRRLTIQPPFKSETFGLADEHLTPNHWSSILYYASLTWIDPLYLATILHLIPVQ